MMVRCRRSDKGIAACAAILGVLLQLFVFAVHGPAKARTAPASPAAGELVIICTAHGTAAVTLDSEGNPVGAPSPIQSRTTCDLCPGMGGLVLAPPADAFILAARPALSPPPPSSEIAIEARPQRAYRNRGPPSQAIA